MQEAFLAIKPWAQVTVKQLQGKPIHIQDLLDDDEEIEEPAYGLFYVSFDNAKKRGKFRHVRCCEAYGAKYPGGHIHLDTQDLPCADFLSLNELQDELDKLGNFMIEWLLVPGEGAP